MTNGEVATKYQEASGKTAPNGPILIVKLYDQLVRDMDLAKEYLTLGDLEGADRSLQHAQKIVFALRSGLRPELFSGGNDLLRLYNTLVDLLVQANLKKDPSVIDRCLEIVAPLHVAWGEAVAREFQKGDAGVERAVE